MGSDAWFWSWSGTTTLAPAVDSEGSGGPIGSGEGPPENIATVGQEDILEGMDRVQKIVQTLDETTAAPQDETTIALQDETTVAPPPTATEAPKTAPAPSSVIAPGNGTSSPKGTSSSEGSGLLTFAGSVPGHGARHESTSDTEVGVWSDSGSGSRSDSRVGTRPGTSWASAAEIEIFKRSEKGKSMVDYRGHKVSHGIGVRLDPQEACRLAHHNIEEVRGFVGTTSEESVNFAKVSEFEDASKLASNIQSPTGESAAKNQQPANSPKRVFQTNPALSLSQRATNTSSQTDAPQDSSSQPQVVPAKHYVGASKMTPTDSGVIKSLTEVEPSQASQFRQVAFGMQEPAGVHQDPVDPPALAESPQCLLLESSLPFCSSMAGQQFIVPNFLNHSRVEEVRILLHDWAWLLNSKCHHSLEWFFCLLLLPKCGEVVQMPCRSFCEVLKDSCWALLDHGHLPVECQALPEDEQAGCQCLSVSNQKGNNWFK